MSGYLSARKQTQKKWPGVKLRSHWVSAECGRMHLLCLTESFELPISALLPANHEKHGAWVKIRAFQEGNQRSSFFSSNAPGGLDPLYDRRVKTPLLLASDANDFLIMVAHEYPGSCCLVVDGHHRLAIAYMAGLKRIKVKAVLTGWKFGDWTPSNRVFWGWFLLPFPRRAAN